MSMSVEAIGDHPPYGLRYTFKCDRCTETRIYDHLPTAGDGVGLAAAMRDIRGAGWRMTKTNDVIGPICGANR